MHCPVVLGRFHARRTTYFTLCSLGLRAPYLFQDLAVHALFTPTRLYYILCTRVQTFDVTTLDSFQYTTYGLSFWSALYEYTIINIYSKRRVQSLSQSIVFVYHSGRLEIVLHSLRKIIKQQNNGSGNLSGVKNEVDSLGDEVGCALSAVRSISK